MKDIVVSYLRLFGFLDFFDSNKVYYNLKNNNGDIEFIIKNNDENLNIDGKITKDSVIIYNHTINDIKEDGYKYEINKEYIYELKKYNDSVIMSKYRDKVVNDIVSDEEKNLNYTFDKGYAFIVPIDINIDFREGLLEREPLKIYEINQKYDDTPSRKEDVNNEYYVVLNNEVSDNYTMTHDSYDLVMFYLNLLELNVSDLNLDKVYKDEEDNVMAFFKHKHFNAIGYMSIKKDNIYFKKMRAAKNSDGKSIGCLSIEEAKLIHEEEKYIYTKNKIRKQPLERPNYMPNIRKYLVKLNNNTDLRYLDSYNNGICLKKARF